MTDAQPDLTMDAPRPDWLDGYAAALRRGWSPNTLRDVSGEQLAAIAADPTAFLTDQSAQSGWIELPTGRVPRLPNRVRWMWDGEFCGAINLRWQPGTTEVPPHCSGHVGYSVVPWKRRRGYATAALRAMVEVAREIGLPFIEATADVENAASRAVIERVGGVLTETRIDPLQGEARKAVYRIDLG